MQIFIYPKDICMLMGRSNIKTGHKYYNMLLKHFNKTKEQGVLISEYCEFYKAEERTVLKLLNPS